MVQNTRHHILQTRIHCKREPDEFKDTNIFFRVRNRGPKYESIIRILNIKKKKSKRP